MISQVVAKKYGSGEAVFVGEIRAMFPEYKEAYLYRLLAREVDLGKIVKFCPGVYYIPKNTLFGNVGISAEQVAQKRYIANGRQKFGIYGGLNLLNIFGVSTQVPFVTEIITNNESSRCREVKIGGNRFLLRKSRCEINRENIREYTLLELLSVCSDGDLRKADVQRTIVGYTKELDRRRLAEMSAYFPARVSKRLIETGVMTA